MESTLSFQPAKWKAPDGKIIDYLEAEWLYRYGEIGNDEWYITVAKWKLSTTMSVSHVYSGGIDAEDMSGTIIHVTRIAKLPHEVFWQSYDQILNQAESFINRQCCDVL